MLRHPSTPCPPPASAASRRTLHLHAIEPASRANGPGLRAVLWFQGCSLGCPGCFNPETHAASGGFEVDTARVVETIALSPVAPRLEGVTFSGGEPFQQPEALLDLLARLAGSRWSMLVFTGHTRGEVERQPLGPAILRRVDALVAGRYVQSRHLGRGLLGSSNQRIHLLTGRYTQADFRDIPVREVILHRDGSVSLTGVSPWRVSASDVGQTVSGDGLPSAGGGRHGRHSTRLNEV